MCPFEAFTLPETWRRVFTDMLLTHVSTLGCICLFGTQLWRYLQACARRYRMLPPAAYLPTLRATSAIGCTARAVLLLPCLQLRCSHSCVARYVVTLPAGAGAPPRSVASFARPAARPAAL